MKRIGLVLSSVFLVLLMALNVAASNTVTSGPGTKQQRTRAIAVAFDNSGSMYTDDDAWCQATYALEIFASMMNEGDTLKVFPMHEVEVRGKLYDKYHPLEVSGGSDTSIFQHMYTPEPGGTPIDTVDAAKAGLKQMQGDEKWLIFVTDGYEFHTDRETIDAKDASKLINKDILDLNVICLQIGSGMDLLTLQEQTGYTRLTTVANSAEEIPDQMISLCNTIFGRDTLPSGHFDTQTKSIDIDLDMRRMIVFVQGEQVDEITLTDASGKAIPSVGRSFSPHYNAGNTENPLLNEQDLKSLMGSIVVFENIPKGKYQLSYKEAGQNKAHCAVYYEPEVVLQVSLLSPQGGEVDLTGRYTAGTYTLKYALTTPEGEEIQSDLLGTTTYHVNTVINGMENTHEDSKKGSMDIEFQPGDTFKFSLDAEYLSGYQIHLDSDDLEWFPKGGLEIEKKDELHIKVGKKQSYYQLSKIEDGSPIFFDLFVNEERLTEEQMQHLNVIVDSGDLKLNQEALIADSQLKLTIIAEQAKTGRFKIKVQGSVPDSYGDPMTAEASTVITIGIYPFWLPWVIAALVILAILILIFLFMNQKVMPRKIRIYSDQSSYSAGHVNYADPEIHVRYSRKRKTGSLRILSPDGVETSCSIILSLQAVSPRYVRSSRRQVLVKSVLVSPMDKATATINGGEYSTEDNILRPDNPDSPDYLMDGANCSMNASYLNVRQRKALVSMSVQLKFL